MTVKQPQSGKRVGEGGLFRPDRVDLRAQEEAARAAARSAKAPAAAAAGAAKDDMVFTDDEELNVLYRLLAKGKVDLDGVDTMTPEETAKIQKDSGMANMLALDPKNREELWQQTEAVESAAYERVARLPPELKGRVAFVEHDLDFMAQTDMDLSDSGLERATRHGMADNEVALLSKRGYAPSSPLVTDARARASGLLPAEIAAMDAKALRDRRFAAAAADVAARELGMEQDAELQRSKRLAALWRREKAAAKAEGRDLRIEVLGELSSSEAERFAEAAADDSSSGSEEKLFSSSGGSGSDASGRSGGEDGSDGAARRAAEAEAAAEGSGSGSEELGGLPPDPSSSDYSSGLEQSARNKRRAASRAAGGSGSSGSGSDAETRARKERAGAAAGAGASGKGGGNGEDADADFVGSDSSSFEDLLPSSLRDSDAETSESRRAREVRLHLWTKAPAAMAMLERAEAEERAERRAERAAMRARGGAASAAAAAEEAAEIAKLEAEARAAGLDDDPEIQADLLRMRRQAGLPSRPGASGSGSGSSSDYDSEDDLESASEFEEHILNDELAELLHRHVKAERRISRLMGLDPATEGPKGFDVDEDALPSSYADFVRASKLALVRHFKTYPAKLEVLAERRRAAGSIKPEDEADVAALLAFMRAEGIPEGDRAAAAAEIDAEEKGDPKAFIKALEGDASSSSDSDSAARAGAAGAGVASGSGSLPEAEGKPRRAGPAAGMAPAGAADAASTSEARRRGQELVALLDMSDDESTKRKSAAASPAGGAAAGRRKRGAAGAGAGAGGDDEDSLPPALHYADPHAAAMAAELKAIQDMPPGPARDAAVRAALDKLDAPQEEAVARVRAARRVARDAKRLRSKIAKKKSSGSDSDDVDVVDAAPESRARAAADAKLAAQIARAKSDLRAAVAAGDVAARRDAATDLDRLREVRRVRTGLRDPLSRVLATRPGAGVLGEDIGSSDGEGDAHAAGTATKRRIRFAPSHETTQMLGFDIASSADEDAPSEEQREELPLLPAFKPSSLRSQTALRAELARAYIKGYKASNEEDDAVLDEQLSGMLAAAADAEIQKLKAQKEDGPVLSSKKEAVAAYSEAVQKMAEVRAILIRELDAGRRTTLAGKLRDAREARDRAAAAIGSADAAAGGAGAGGAGASKASDKISLSGDDSSDWGGDPADARFLVDRGQQLRDYNARMGVRDTDEEALQLLDLGRDGEERTRIAPAFGDDLHRIPASILDEFSRPYEFDADEDEAPYPDALTVRGALMLDADACC